MTGITPEELQKKTVADITKQNLDIIFIGINPGYHSALTGHHYSGSGTFYDSLPCHWKIHCQWKFWNRKNGSKTVGKNSKNIFR